MLFPTEQARIDHICDHCRSIAFDIIKIRCLDGTYSTAEEVLEDLHNVYGECDAVGKAIARLQSPDFSMKKKETFDGFLPKFAATIAPLQLSEQFKILRLKRTITPCLRWQTTNGFERTSFWAYVQQLRQCDFDLRQLDHESKALRRDQDYDTEESESNDGPRGYDRAGKHSKETLNKLRHGGKYFRCQQPGHMKT